MVRIRTTLAALLLAVAGAAPAFAEDKTENILWSAKADPDAMAPGGSGAVVITGAIRKTVHVFSEPARFKVIPTEAKGVTWGKYVTTPPKAWVDPQFPDDPPSDVWFDHVEVRVPFQLASDVELPVTLEVVIKWNCCDEEACFAEATTKPALRVQVRPLASTVPSDPPATPPGPPATPPTPAAPPAAAAPTASLETPGAKVTVVAEAAAFVVTFEPQPGHHLYPVGHTGPENAAVVEGEPAPGVTWGTIEVPLVESPEIREPYRVRLPFRETGGGTAPISVRVAWQVCLDTGVCRAPEAPRRFTLDRRTSPASLVAGLDLGAGATAATARPGPTGPTASDPREAPPPPPAGSASSGASVAEHGVLFPEVGEAAAAAGVAAGDDVDAGSGWKKHGIWYLVILFVTGIGLAFTPCVLPIIPITVSLIGGGRADLAKGRLAFLLTCYVLGLVAAFGTMGLLAAKAGASFSAAFQSATALWVIAGVFLVLSLGMFGIYELQPPAWAQRMMGGAKGGNPVGAFLFGIMSALIASPCTGPVIAGLVVYTAQSGNALLGFLMFAMLGLGMGAVFFAAGSFNFLLKPGPWMVWVRYVFGVVLVGAALYYLRSADRVGPVGLFALGFGMAVVVAAGIAWHLVKKEGEQRDVALRRGVKVAGCVAIVTGAVAFLTRHASDLPWTTVTSRAQLVAEVAAARKDGKVTVVDVWATWCTYCRKYDDVIEGDPELLEGYRKLHRLRIDLTDRPSYEQSLREGLRIEEGVQPYMVFIDEQGRIRRDFDVNHWLRANEGGPVGGLKKRLQALGVLPTPKS